MTIPVQVGGGIRTIATAEQLFASGVSRVILGTVAYRQPAVVAEACRRFPGRITVGIDARAGKVAVQGWTEATELDAVTLAQQCADMGVNEIVYTDIARDGTAQGVNVDATLALARTVALPIIASGGVASLRDIERLAPLHKEGIAGVIVGRALYTGAVNLAEAIALAKGLAS